MKKKSTTTSRKNLTKKIRFEVLKRDNFQCKYCGKKAPDVVLEVDHIKPVAKGGDNSMLNLITACFDCNRGKRDIKLSDKQEVKKQRKELEILGKEREQIELLKKWKDELKNNNSEKLELFLDHIYDCSYNRFTLNEQGKKELNVYIKKYENKMLLNVITTSFEQYFNNPEEEELANEEFHKSFNYIPRIIKTKIAQQENPDLKNLYYCRKIIENRCGYFDKWRSTEMLKELFKLYSFGEIKEMCCNLKNWSDFTNEYDYMVGDE